MRPPLRLRLPAFGTVLRVTAAATLLAVALSVYAPRLAEQRTREAVVNARLEPVRTPLAGRLVRAPAAPGTPVEAGAVLAVVEDPRVSREALSRFEAELAAARAERAVVARALAELDERRRLLEARAERFARAALAARVAERRALEERMVAARARVAERRARLERMRRLLRHRAVAEEEVQRAERELVEAEAALRVLRWRHQRLRTELRALARDVHLDRGGADAPWSRQRLEDLRAEAARWRARRSRLEARIAALERAVARERARVAAAGRATVRAPMDAVIWRREVAAGGHVARDQPLVTLLDCRRLFVTAIVHQRDLADLAAGTRARVRPLGGRRWIAGRVLAVRAASFGPEDGFAVPLRPLEEDEAVVLVALEPTDLQHDAARFCHVGRSVELALARDWALARWWRGARPEPEARAAVPAADPPRPAPAALLPPSGGGERVEGTVSPSGRRGTGGVATDAGTTESAATGIREVARAVAAASRVPAGRETAPASPRPAPVPDDHRPAAKGGLRPPDTDVSTPRRRGPRAVRDGDRRAGGTEAAGVGHGIAPVDGAASGGRGAGERARRETSVGAPLSVAGADGPVAAAPRRGFDPGWLAVGPGGGPWREAMDPEGQLAAPVPWAPAIAPAAGGSGPEMAAWREAPAAMRAPARTGPGARPGRPAPAPPRRARSGIAVMERGR